jgi:hypothetical protein
MTLLWTSARVTGLALGFFFYVVVSASGETALVLDDEELSRIAAGAPLADDRPTTTAAPLAPVVQQTITGTAQQGASAMILVNSVASTVSAQVNLIVNTGSISHASQANAGAPRP